VLIVTTICFADDPGITLAEACRVLEPEGAVAIGSSDRSSRLGKHYEARRKESVVHGEANFFSTGEVGELLSRTGYGECARRRTPAKSPAKTAEFEPPRPGFGEGAFVVVRAVSHAT
jgi:hypothetical protein